MTINVRGQTGFNLPKQLQIQDYLKQYQCDVLHLQEVHINEDSFSNCNYILNNYSVITNNNTNNYGVCSLIKSEYEVSHINKDNEGRVIVFNISE